MSRPVRIAATAPASSSVRMAARWALPPKMSQLPAQPAGGDAVLGGDGADDQRERHVADEQREHREHALAGGGRGRAELPL